MKGRGRVSTKERRRRRRRSSFFKIRPIFWRENNAAKVIWKADIASEGRKETMEEEEEDVF